MKKIILTFTVYFSTTSVSHAYLDPGTGSAILQALIAALAACGVMMSNYWKKVKLTKEQQQEIILILIKF